VDRKEIAETLDEIGTLLELKGENPFKCRAFHNASRIIGSFTGDIAALVEANALRSIKGIGEGLALNISEMVKTGKSAYADDLRKSVPEGVLAMLRIQGLGPKKVRLLFEQLKLTSIEQLREAAASHRLSNVEGFGEKTEANILKGIEALSRHSERRLYPEAERSGTRLLDALRKVNGVMQCEIAGSLRRRKETIGDIDLLASARPGAIGRIMEAFCGHPDVAEVSARGETKSSVLLKNGIRCDLRVVSGAEFPFALNYFTGSKEHNIGIRSRAKEFGLSLNEYGFSASGAPGSTVRKKRAPSCKTEEDIYHALKLKYIPPELREQMGEIESAEAGLLPNLVNEDDIRGTFHCHTTYSDGLNSLEEMANAAISAGWEYLGIADHSKVAAYARGLTATRVKQQFNEIDTLNGSFKGFRLFKGTEVDILPDGSLDWNDSILKSFDYVVASIHSKFKMTESEATRRIIKALKNKHVTMLGHPTGRLLLERDGYPVNMVEVIDAAADYGKMIEINAHPMRLDLDWRLCHYARDKGVKISINPDAHAIEGLRDVRYGVYVARKGWLEAKDIFNTQPLLSVIKALNSR
jgi:DNA polymerase (family 10)